jgi:hypothetical protein
MKRPQEEQRESPITLAREMLSHYIIDEKRYNRSLHCSGSPARQQNFHVSGYFGCHSDNAVLT